MSFNVLLLCKDDIWNSSIVHSENPDFTTCFQKTFLVWIPSIYLLLFSFLLVHDSLPRYRSRRPFNLNWVVLSKLFALVSLILVEIATVFIDTISNVTTDNNIYFLYIFKSVLLVISYIFIMLVIYWDKINAKSKGYNILLTIYWMISLFCWLLILRSKIINFNELDKIVDLVLFSADLALHVTCLILSFFSQNRDKKSVETQKTSKIYPESRVSLLTWLTFSWVIRLVFRAYKHDLKKSDVWEMDESNACKNVSNDLELKWNANISEFYRKQKPKIARGKVNDDFERKQSVKNSFAY